jgi:hypothetical protein
MKKNFKIILSFLLIAAIAVAVFTGCDDNANDSQSTTAQTTMSQTTEEENKNEEPETPSDSNDNSDSSEPEDIGEGETTFLFEFTDKDDNKLSWNVSTDETTVGAALLEVELVEGTVGEYGLFVTVVNGVELEEDNAYWEFQIDGEMSMTGVDSTDIEEDVVYAFVYTTY